MQVAQRGQIRLKRQGVREQGFGKVMKKALTGEGITLVKTEGLGKLYCADQKKMISIIELDNDSLSVNGNDILALSASLQYDIKFIKGAGMIAGGLFNCRVCCHCSVTAISWSDCSRMLRECGILTACFGNWKTGVRKRIACFHQPWAGFDVQGNA